jgi:hypothetical protein
VKAPYRFVPQGSKFAQLERGVPTGKTYASFEAARTETLRLNDAWRSSSSKRKNPSHRRNLAQGNQMPQTIVRRNYSTSVTTNYLRGLRPGQVERLVREDALGITHADIGNGYHTVTLFEQGRGENYKQVEAKWFVRGEDEWYDLSNDLRNGKIDPSTADVFLGPSRWDKREREEQTRAAAKRKGIDIAETYHYFNNPKVRRNSEQKYVVTVDSGFSQTGYEGDRSYSFEATEKRLSQILAAEWSSFHGQHADFLNDLRTKGKARLGSSWSFIEAHAKKSNPARRQNSKSRR